MTINDFTQNHIEEATNLAKNNYEEERRSVPALPLAEVLPDLTGFSDNGLGVAMHENGRMVGFMCCCRPWEAITAHAKGTFSPIHAHGAIGENRGMIYRRLYQASAEKWAAQGISWHAVALYAHDRKAMEAFYTYGFGLRCMDAIRPMEEVPFLPCGHETFCELAADESNRLLSMKNMLIEHLGKSPSFMYFPPETEAEFEATHKRRRSRYFCACRGNEPVAYIEVMDKGENFACDDKSMQNICGAYCCPECRGRGTMQNLLNFTIRTLKKEGYSRLGVDFESFNPTAFGFWLKYFSAYTHSVVRRIDEKILEMRG